MREAFSMNPMTNIAQSRRDFNDILPEPGAIREWHGQLRAGLRKTTDIDALSRAACAEFNAREWTFHPPTCNEYRRQAAAIMRTIRPELIVTKPNVISTPAPFAGVRPTSYALRLAR